MIDRQKAGGTPAGLSFLEKVDGLFIEQQWLVLETITCGCYQGQNKYKVSDRSGKVQLFTVQEVNGCCSREICGSHRPFKMNVLDETGNAAQKMIVFERNYAFCGWAVCPCCMHHVNVYYVVDASGHSLHPSAETLVARVQVPWLGGCCVPTYNIQDRNGEHAGHLEGPCCCVSDFCGADFKVHDKNGNKVGDLEKLSVKTLKSLAMELETQARNFKINFPDTLDPTIKMAVLAAVFEIDYEFFEDDRSPRECRFWDFYCCGAPCSCFPVWCACCCYGTKEKREEAEEKKERGHGAPEVDETMTY